MFASNVGSGTGYWVKNKKELTEDRIQRYQYEGGKGVLGKSESSNWRQWTDWSNIERTGQCKMGCCLPIINYSRRNKKINK